MAERKFKTANGKDTDIYHSYGYACAPYQMRQQMAFNKEFRKGLSERDKYLMQGYAQRVVEEQNAFKFNNPDYKTKNAPRMSGKTISGHFNKHAVENK